MLNTGLKEYKSNMEARYSYGLMKESSEYEFIGNFKTDKLFASGRAGVIVTDGFVGELVSMFNFENFGGTTVLGIRAPLVIGHGTSTEKAMGNMLHHPAEIVEAGLVNRIKEELDI